MYLERGREREREGGREEVGRGEGVGRGGEGEKTDIIENLKASLGGRKENLRVLASKC